ncbi:origin recognition complex subunit 1 isoform X3 [Brienomyrus brachyistius]|uniref:origin recognition complex subunit 1 isoform X3 n=1 Tax=Brienomyrus brachyistius TaxID=42636 RepID=UPI0020B433B0|nr:origin recognition complex subunit 1 isoform X3 [Brienomyrus brachyistius]
MSEKMSQYFTRLRIRRFYSWGGRPYIVNRQLKIFYYNSLCLKTDGHPEPCVIKPGQYILIEGDDDDYPYVAKLLKLYETDKRKLAEVQWFIRFHEIPQKKRCLLGREAHSQEVFSYLDKTCDTEIDAETIIDTVQVVFLATDASFPENGSKRTLYVKQCWDTKAFRPVEAERVQPGPKPAPPVAPPPAPVPRSLPTPDVVVMKRARSVSLRQLSRSVGKMGASEAESSHSASKLSASKALSRKRRGSCEATPGVRKKLDLSSPGKRLTTDDILDELLLEEVQSQVELAGRMSASPPRSSARVFSLSPIKVPNKSAAVFSPSRSTDRGPPCRTHISPLPKQDSARDFGSTPLGEEAGLGDVTGSSSAVTPRRSSRRAAKARTPSLRKESSSSALRERALGSVRAEEPPVDQAAMTPRSKRKSALLVSSRIKKQLNLLNSSANPISDDSEDDCFLPAQEPKSGCEDEEGEEEGSENDSGTVKKGRQTSHTPRSTRKGLVSARTPRRTPSKKAPPTTPRTPRHATPSIPARCLPARKPRNVLEEARERLHVSSVPESLPCREQEFQDIYSFVESKIVDGIGGCMYISGVPGTGKTATVHEVIRSLQQAAELDEIPAFRFIEINGMKMTDPHQAYVQILQKLTDQKATADHAATLLAKRFSNPAPKKETTVLLVDELDLLWTRKQNVMYNLFDWPTRRHARLVVLAIANTMDLPERIMMNRVASRLGLTRMSFQPYTFKQLQQIITSRLNHVKAFEEDALQLVSRKVAALSGDARRCLDICRRATEICEYSAAQQSGSGLVGMSHVMEALDEMFSSSYITAIRCASVQEQLFLRAVLAEFRRLGLEEATFQQVFVQHQALCRVEGLQPISISEGLAVCQRLGACRLLLLEPSRLDVLLRVRLNVSQDDVLYALKEE